MDRLVAIGFLISVAVIGRILIIRDLRRAREKTEFATEFMKLLGIYYESQGDDHETYSWLIHRSPKMQTEMGDYGVFSRFRPPYANYMYNNYPVILNLMPEIRKEFEDYRLSGDPQTLNEYRAMLNESILRYLGNLRDYREPRIKECMNPVIWFREGFSWIVLLPLTIMSWIGLFGEKSIRKIAQNPLIRILAGLVALLGLVSSVVTIVVGWSAFVNAVNQLLMP